MTPEELRLTRRNRLDMLDDTVARLMHADRILYGFEGVELSAGQATTLRRARRDLGAALAGIAAARLMELEDLHQHGTDT